MRNTHLLVTLVILFFTVSITSVFGAGYSSGTPSIGGGVAGAPALTGNNLGGTFTVTYPNGRPVTLAVTQVTLRLCGSICVTVTATITQVGPGTYTYSFVFPTSLGGAVTIFIPTGSLTDEYGKPFPNADTQIATYSASTPASSVTTPPSQNNPTIPTPQLLDPDRIASAAIRPESSLRLTHQAVAQDGQTEHESSISQLILALIVPILGACGLLILPSRKS